MVTIKRIASVIDFESPAIPFWAASAITTITNRSATPIEPDCRRNIRRMAYIARYIIVPRMKISTIDSVGTNIDCQSILKKLIAIYL